MSQQAPCYRNCLRWLPAILIATAIFLFSNQPAGESTDLSQGVTYHFLMLLDQVHLTHMDGSQQNMLIGLIEPAIRKLAHAFEFTVLYLSLLYALHSRNTGHRREKITWFRTAFLLTFLYACTDEFHQLFVPGRAGRFTDVLIDCSIALLITLFAGRIFPVSSHKCA